MATAQNLYLEGLKLYGQRRHAEAVERYEEALREQPEWPECLQALSMALMHAGRLEEALAKAERMAELAPSDPLAFTSLSMILQRLDRIEDAETAQSRARMLSWKEELKSNPNAPPPAGMGGIESVE